MAFVDEEQEILREEIDQAKRALAGPAAGQVPRVVLDPAAKAHLLQHLQVVVRAHSDALGLEVLSVFLERGDSLLQLGLDARDGALELAARGHVLVGGIKIELVERAEHRAGQRVEFTESLDRLAPEFHAQALFKVGGHHIDHFAAHPEAAALQLVVIPVIEVVNQPDAARLIVKGLKVYVDGQDEFESARISI